MFLVFAFSFNSLSYCILIDRTFRSLLAAVMTPASDSCGSQGIRTVLSPSGYIGPSPPVGLGPPSATNQLGPGRGGGFGPGSGLLSPPADDETSSTDGDDPWSCLLVFRMSVGQQLNISLLDFTAAARAEFAAMAPSSVDGESGSMDSSGHAAPAGHQDQQEQHQHLSRSHQIAARDKQVIKLAAPIKSWSG